MPTYDYKCSACGKKVEYFQHITEDPLKKCPKCGKNKLQRQIGGGAGLIFKGSGFYITDYKNKKVATADTKSKSDTKEKKTDKKEKSKSVSEKID